MAQEYQRTRGRKKIKLPGGETIDVPVIIKISFADPYDRYQETEHNIDNSDESNRIIHVDKVHPVDVDDDGRPTSDAPTQDTSTSLYVERIDTWNAADPYDRYQETQLSLDNVTGNDQLPPHFLTHERTHIYRYYKDPQNPDNSSWIDSELIDEFIVTDPYDRYQETHYTLANPTNAEFDDGDLSGQASDDDPDITIGGSGEGTQDNPVRLDPFQNIVNFSPSGELFIVIGGTLGTFGGNPNVPIWRMQVFDVQGNVKWTAEVDAPILGQPFIACTIDSSGDAIVAWANNASAPGYAGGAMGLIVKKFKPNGQKTTDGLDEVDTLWTFNINSIGFTGGAKDLLCSTSCMDTNGYFTIASTVDATTPLGDSFIGLLLTLNGKDGTLVNRFDKLPQGLDEYLSSGSSVHHGFLWIAGHCVNPDGQICVSTTSEGIVSGFKTNPPGDPDGDVAEDGCFGFFYNSGWTLPHDATVPPPARFDYIIYGDAFFNENVESQLVCSDGLGNFYGSVFHNGFTGGAPTDFYATIKLYKWSGTGTLVFERYLSDPPTSHSNITGGISCLDGDVNGNLYYSLFTSMGSSPFSALAHELVKLDPGGNTVWKQDPPEFSLFLAASDGLITSLTDTTYEKRDGNTPSLMKWRNDLGVTVLQWGRQNKKGTPLH